MILPEGPRTRDGNLRPFKKLPFFLAKQADIPILPMGLSGLFELRFCNLSLQFEYLVRRSRKFQIPNDQMTNKSQIPSIQTALLNVISQKYCFRSAISLVMIEI